MQNNEKKKILLLFILGTVYIVQAKVVNFPCFPWCQWWWNYQLQIKKNVSVASLFFNRFANFKLSFHKKNTSLSFSTPFSLSTIASTQSHLTDYICHFVRTVFFSCFINWRFIVTIILCWKICSYLIIRSDHPILELKDLCTERFYERFGRLFSYHWKNNCI